jgi:hypothetical protein
MEEIRIDKATGGFRVKRGQQHQTAIKPMKILPQGRQGWFGLALLPFKAYVVIAPVLVFISAQLPRPRHTGATDAEAFMILGLFPCGVILLIAALVLAVTGRKESADPCAGFGVAALVIGYLLRNSLASA